MGQRKLLMEARWFVQRHRRTLLLVIACTFLLGLLYASSKKLVYLENNVVFSSSLIDLPYEADHKPENPRIPKIIHQTWIGQNVPKQFATWMATWPKHNIEFEYWFWTDAESRRFIAEKYPEFLDLFDSYAFNIQRADVIRYFVLYEYGGIYADLDVEVLKPLDGILKESCYLSQEPLEHAYFFWGIPRLACNAVMACRPKHPYFKFVIENLKYYKGLSVAPFVKVSMPVMESSGPKMITYTLNRYEEKTDLQAWNKVFLWPAEYFFPDADELCMPYVKRKCSSASYRQSMTPDLLKVCEYHERTNYANKPHPDPYANHHWSHTYYGVKKLGVISIKVIIPKARLVQDWSVKE